ncbi:hypothetical protein BJX99DRAFT_268801 [Aspergillus californicus]
MHFTETERRLAGERHLKYQGTARVHLNQIYFDPVLKIDDAKLDRLRRIIYKEGCRRLDIGNHATAVVSHEGLQSSLLKAGISRAALLTNEPPQYPLLEFEPPQLQCLHGHHRIKIGRELLPPTDRCPELRTSLIEEYSNEKPSTDGEVYRKIRQYESEHNARFRKRWLSRLSPNKEKRLKSLLAHEEFRSAFDQLLSIPGLWAGLRIGNFGKLLSIKCDEEIIRYLEFIHEFWTFLVGENNLMRVDQHTVEELQLKAPGVSESDFKKVRGLIENEEILLAFTRDERKEIWEKLQNFDRLIPSLFTFFEDLKFLTACTECIRRLFPIQKYHPTVSTTMRHSFQPRGGELSIHVSNYQRRQVHGVPDQFDISQREIWLFAMRHYPQMGKDSKREDLLAKAPGERADETIIFEMATLARNVGFENPQIAIILEESPDNQIAHAALLKARKPERYQYDPGELNNLIHTITECFSRAEEHMISEQNKDGILIDKNASQRRCVYFVLLSLNHHMDTTSRTPKTDFSIRTCFLDRK